MHSLRNIKGCGRLDVFKNGGEWKEVNIQDYSENGGINGYRQKR
jgi:hypothetical protein